MASLRPRRITYDVFVGNLPDSANERTVGSLFTCYGETQSLFVKDDKSGTCKIAYVRYLCEPDAKQAVQDRNGWIWDGKVLSVKLCEKTKDDKNKHRPKHRNQQNNPSQENTWQKNSTGDSVEDDIFASANKSYLGSARIQNPGTRGNNEAKSNSLSSAGDGNVASVRKATKEKNETAQKEKIGNSTIRAGGDASMASKQKKLSINNADQQQQQEELIVSHIENLNTIFCYRVSQTNELISLTNALETLCPTLEKVQGKPEMLKLYATVFSEDQMWYRCIVIKNDLTGQSVVRYTDYGNREIVNNSNIVKLPDHLANIPFFSIKCRFANLNTIEQTENPKKYEEGIKFLHETISDKVLKTVLRPLAVGNAYCIIRCNVGDLNIGQELVRRGYATAKERVQLRGRGFSASESSPRSSNPVWVGGTLQANCHGTGSSPLWLGGTLQANCYGSRLPFCDPLGSKNHLPTKKFGLLGSYPVQSFTTFPSTPEEKLATAAADRKKERRKILGSSTPTPADMPNAPISSSNPGEWVEKLISERDSLKRELAAEKNKLQVAEQQLQSMAIDVAQNNLLDKIMYVISAVTKVREVRQRVPILADQEDIIEMAYSVITKDDNIFQQDGLQHKVKDAELKYQATLERIRECTEKAQLPPLKKERDDIRQNLYDLLEEFLNSINRQPLSEIIFEFEEIQSLLEQVYHPFLEARNFNSENLKLNELISNYHNMKSERRAFLQKITQNTDQVHKNLMDTLASLKQALSINSSILKGDNIKDDVNAEKSTFSPSQLVISFTQMQQALAEEVSACDLESTPDSDVMANITQGLHWQLATRLGKAKNVMKLCEQYDVLHKQIHQCLDPTPNVQKLQAIRKNIKSIKSKLRHKLADKNDLEENEEGDQEALTEVNCELATLRRDLHENFVQEDNFMVLLNEGYTTHLPELELEYPEINLSSFSEYKGLLKQGWDLDHFNTEKLNTQLGVVYKAVFLNCPVVLKEYLIESEETKRLFLQRALSYQCIYCDHLLPVQAIFFSKNQRQAYVQNHFFSATLQDEIQNNVYSPQVINYILYGVLKALDALHSNKKTYGMLHPSTVFIQPGYCAVLDVPDFSSEKQCFLAKIQGINFSAPETRSDGQCTSSSDMYSFGCLMLCSLLPSVFFQENSSDIPDISIYDELLLDVSKDAASAIYSLLQFNPPERPSAKILLANSYFSRLSDPEYIASFPDDDVVSASLPEDETEADGQDVNTDGNNSDNYYEDDNNNEYEENSNKDFSEDVNKDIEEFTSTHYEEQ